MKYRILEEISENKSIFYPQRKKHWFSGWDYFWDYDDINVDDLDRDYVYAFEFDTLRGAITFIDQEEEKRKKQNSKTKFVIHNYL